jgi:hypothetical protein
VQKKVLRLNKQTKTKTKKRRVKSAVGHNFFLVSTCSLYVKNTYPPVVHICNLGIGSGISYFPLLLFFWPCVQSINHSLTHCLANLISVGAR